MLRYIAERAMLGAQPLVGLGDDTGRRVRITCHGAALLSLEIPRGGELFDGASGYRDKDRAPEQTQALADIWCSKAGNPSDVWRPRKLSAASQAIKRFDSPDVRSDLQHLNGSPRFFKVGHNKSKGRRRFFKVVVGSAAKDATDRSQEGVCVLRALQPAKNRFQKRLPPDGLHQALSADYRIVGRPEVDLVRGIGVHVEQLGTGR